MIEPFKVHVEIKTIVLLGTPFLEVVGVILRNAHDLVIKFPESPSWLDCFFSGDDVHLLRKCPWSVSMVKPQTGKS